MHELYLDDAPTTETCGFAGGLPAGVDASEWPSLGGRPLIHLLSLDLQRVPLPRAPEGARALSLFVSGGHDPGEDGHIALRWIAPEAFARGELPPPPHTRTHPRRPILAEPLLLDLDEEPPRGLSRTGDTPDAELPEDGSWPASDTFILQLQAPFAGLRAEEGALLVFRDSAHILFEDDDDARPPTWQHALPHTQQLVPAPDADPTLCFERLGGLPRDPHVYPHWPHSEDGLPLSFLASLALPDRAIHLFFDPADIELFSSSRPPFTLIEGPLPPLRDVSRDSAEPPAAPTPQTAPVEPPHVPELPQDSAASVETPTEHTAEPSAEDAPPEAPAEETPTPSVEPQVSTTEAPDAPQTTEVADTPEPTPTLEGPEVDIEPPRDALEVAPATATDTLDSSTEATPESSEEPLAEPAPTKAHEEPVQPALPEPPAGIVTLPEIALVRAPMPEGCSRHDASGLSFVGPTPAWRDTDRLPASPFSPIHFQLAPQLLPPGLPEGTLYVLALEDGFAWQSARAEDDDHSAAVAEAYDHTDYYTDRFDLTLASLTDARLAELRSSMRLIERVSRDPSRDAVSRIGGLPRGISAERWPRLDDTPMTHIMSVELGELLPGPAVAVSVFLSSAYDHDAYRPFNSHAAVLLVTADDVANTAPLTQAPEGARVLATHAVELREVPPEMTIAELGKHAYFGGAPMWLDEEDAAGGESFLMQLDENTTLVGLSKGRLYVFEHSAWVQLPQS